MFLEVTSPRFYSASPSSSCIHMLAGGVTKTQTSMYEVSFPLEETMGNKVFAFLIVFSSYYPPTKSEGYSFGVVRASVRLSVRPSIPSVRPSVRNHISVPIGQI